MSPISRSPLQVYFATHVGELGGHYARLLRERILFYRPVPEERLKAGVDSFMTVFVEESLTAWNIEPMVRWSINNLRVRAQQGLSFEEALALATHFRRAILLTIEPLLETKVTGVHKLLILIDDFCETVIGEVTRFYAEALESAQRALAESEAQEARLREMSTPLIPVSDGVVVMPLVGLIDPARADQLRQVLLEGISAARAKVAILDVTGVPAVDGRVAAALLSAVAAARLLGAEVVLTGITPRAARAFVEIGADFRGVVTRATLKDGIAHALAQERR